MTPLAAGTDSLAKPASYGQDPADEEQEPEEEETKNEQPIKPPQLSSNDSSNSLQSMQSSLQNMQNLTMMAQQAALFSTLQAALKQAASKSASPNGAMPPSNLPTDTSSYIPPAGISENAGSNRELIVRTALQYGVKPDLALTVAQLETKNYDSNAISRPGAQGVMQLMPPTAKRFGVSDPFDPQQNVEGGVKYLKYLNELFHGDTRLILAAYNAGEGAVQQYGGVPPYPETQRYVQKGLSLLGKA